MQAHGARVLLLAEDLADTNPTKLRQAISRWAAAKPFLPKASELRAIIEDIDARQLGTESLQEWCDDGNEFARRIGADWWYRVSRRDVEGRQTFYVEKLEGIRAVEERARAEGKPIRPWKPTPEEIAKIHAFTAKCAAEGMTQTEFNRMVDRGRGA